jgi:hypothetical protein
LFSQGNLFLSESELSFPQGDIRAAWHVVSAVCHLRNLTFGEIVV